jgi:hypothetical protein
MLIYYFPYITVALWRNMLLAFSGKKSNGGICVDVNGKFRISGGFTSMKVSQLDRMLCNWKEKFISLLGLNCFDDLFLQKAAMLNLLAQASMLERVIASVFRWDIIKAVCSSRIVCKYSRLSFYDGVTFWNIRL